MQGSLSLFLLRLYLSLADTWQAEHGTPKQRNSPPHCSDDVDLEHAHSDSDVWLECVTMQGRWGRRKHSACSALPDPSPTPQVRLHHISVFCLICIWHVILSWEISTKFTPRSNFLMQYTNLPLLFVMVMKLVSVWYVLLSSGISTKFTLRSNLMLVAIQYWIIPD